MAPPGGYLRAGEEEWQELFDRLQERFPTVGPERVAQILRDNEGHAGQAAAALRDLTSAGMREVDPDDAEHVATLLSSPVMFSHACKEHFRKFDVNGDGVLEWKEVLDLTNSLYDNFGLQAPREAGLKSFFDATDTNGDGVLSEKEFKKFFECFLRYAFFDVVKHKQEVAATAQEVEQVPTPQPRRSAERAAKETRSQRSPAGLKTSGKHRESRHAEATTQERSGRSSPHGSRRESSDVQPVAEEQETAVKPTSGGHGAEPAVPSTASTMFRCVAPHGVSYRRTPEYSDRAGSSVHRGETVQVLETWVRTPEGWLPCSDPRGLVLFERVQAGDEADGAAEEGRKVHFTKHRTSGSSHTTSSSKRSSKAAAEGEETAAGAVPSHSKRTSKNHVENEDTSGGKDLKQDEQDWKDRFERLQERFPAAGPERVLRALRDVGGHAGQAASLLRDSGL